MREPGGVTDLGDAGAAAWAEHVRRLFSTGAADVARELQTENGSVLASPTPETATVTAPDWTGLPVRVTACLGRDRGLRLLDRRSERVDGGGRRWQEDYVEWRVLRHRGRIERVELTTELADYWRVLAAYDPARLLETVAGFAGERAVRPGLVFGAVDPFGDGVTPERRGEAFDRTMLPPHGRSPYNNGARAICCMTESTNSLRGLIMLVLAAASCRVVRDSLAGQLRCLTCLEAIPLIGNATLGRSSDPVLVERLGQLAYEGRLVAFDDPVGVYMQAVEHTRLRTPADEEVPSEWFAFSRGVAAGDSPDGRARYQRVTFEVPPGEGFVVGDLVDVATERPIRYGGEIADLLRLVTFFRVSAADAVVVDRKAALELGTDRRDDGCNGIRAYERRLARGAA